MGEFLLMLWGFENILKFLEIRCNATTCENTIDILVPM
jgi:hypothetical protein